MKTTIEPFKIKVVEPIRMTTRKERDRALAAASWNLFQIPSDDVLIDLLTDSGTSAMSEEQWAGMMRGDEAYAGSPSWKRFDDAVREVTGYPFILPTHQGRAAERILFSTLCGPGKIVPNNTHFDTTRANVEITGARAVDLPCAAGKDPALDAPFKGDMDVEGLRALLEREAANVPLVMLTVTNNSGGGQPVSMANVRAVRETCDAFGVPLYLDACRFAENSWFVKQREPGYADRTPREIARELFSLAHGCTMSAKKDAFANIGGFLCTDDANLARSERNLLILTEGFPTYGGLAGRDLEAIAIGLREILEEDYLRYRIQSTAYVQRHLDEAGVPVMRPAGGHAVYIDAARFLPHVPRAEFPGQSVAVELYRHAGIRGCEIGSVMFGDAARMELVRLAIPRRVYTQAHMDYVIEAVCEVHARRESFRGYRIAEEPAHLRHFSARFEPL